MITVDPSDARTAAIKRLSDRRDYVSHLVSYAVVNLALIAVWFFTGRGYFWPAWILGCWGMGLLLHAWALWGRRPITEEDVRREMAHLQPH
jgi:hypothetical protein